MQKLLVLVAMNFIFIGCSSKEPKANSPPQTYLTESMRDSTPRPGKELSAAPMEQSTSPNKPALSAPVAAFEGQVLIADGDLPTPASRVSLGIFQIRPSGEKVKITSLTTESDGRFKVTRPLNLAMHEIIVEDPRYEGSAQVDLSNGRWLRELILEIKPRSQKKK